MRDAYIGLGGNLGKVSATFASALAALVADGRVRFLEGSSLYETPPWGGIAQPDYLNAVARVATELGPHDLLARLLDVERQHGRDRAHEQRWGPRALDLDLLLMGDLRCHDATLALPHPRMLSRAFVVVPLLEIAPDLVLPDGTRLCDVDLAREGAIMRRLDQRAHPGEI